MGSDCGLRRKALEFYFVNHCLCRTEAHLMPPASQPLPALPRKSLEERFLELRARWKGERGPTSSLTELAMHPSYQQIIGLGPDAVPLLLRELERDPDHWFWALKAITGEDPVAPERRGKLRDMAQDWISWGRKQGFKW